MTTGQAMAAVFHRAHRTGCLEIGKQRIQMIIGQGKHLHVHDRIRKAATDQHIAKIMHIGKALGMRIAIASEAERNSLSESGAPTSRTSAVRPPPARDEPRPAQG